MARFKYLGEAKRQCLQRHGRCESVDLPSMNGRDVLLPIPPAKYFGKDTDIGYDITDELSLLAIRNDKRFQEL